MMGHHIHLYSLHGLIRGKDIELGANADTGGQHSYVVDLARTLGEQSEVDEVVLLTRQINDPDLSTDYAQPTEKLNEKARIIRLPCGPPGFVAKENLWEFLPDFVSNAKEWTVANATCGGSLPTIIHGHYAESGHVATEMAAWIKDYEGGEDVSLIFTPHSLGLDKRAYLEKLGMSYEDMQRRYKINHRVDAERYAMTFANLILASTSLEATGYLPRYVNPDDSDKIRVLGPGVDSDRFPLFSDTDSMTDCAEQRPAYLVAKLKRMLHWPYRPLILSIGRSVSVKNMAGLIQAYGSDKELKHKANLCLLIGQRSWHEFLSPAEKEVWEEILFLIDDYDLYGRVAIPKTHCQEKDIPAYYRLAAELKGVYAGVSFNEGYGMTFLEAMSSGLPFVGTMNGGPADILRANPDAGLLVDPGKPSDIATALSVYTHAPNSQSIWRNASAAGRRAVEKHYSWDRHCTRYLEMASQLQLT